MEELKNEMMEMTDEERFEADIPEEEGAHVTSLVPIVGALILLGGAGAAAFIVKDKLASWKEARTVKKLHKKGYRVEKSEPEDVETEDVHSEN